MSAFPAPASGPLASAIAAPSLSVVIPVRNGASTLYRQLQSLANQSSVSDFEVIISDNGSTDALHDVIAATRRAHPALDIHLVDSSAKRGVSHARNVGADAARASFVAFCDSDDIVGPEWIQAMIDGLTVHAGVGGPLDEYSLNDGAPLQVTMPADQLPVGLEFLPYPVGANCGVRHEVWQELGGFDESFLNGAEEVDFFWRLQLAGYSLGFAPKAVVAYRHPSELRAIVRRGYRYGIGSCQLADAHRRHLPRESRSAIARVLLRLLIRLPLVVVPKRRSRYLGRLAHYAGQVVGSRRYRVLHLS